MWTKEHRARQAAFGRRRYPTALTDEERERAGPLPPRPAGRGRAARHGPARGAERDPLPGPRRVRPARMLPVHFGPWRTVYRWFRRSVRRLPFRAVHDTALMLDRERAGRGADPSAGVLDSQTVEAPHAPGGGGYDAAKRTKGRKRRVAVDTDGRLLMADPAAADAQGAAGAELVAAALRERWPWLKHLFADGAYDRGKLVSAAAYRDFAVEVVRKLPGQKGFQVLPSRWVGSPRCRRRPWPRRTRARSPWAACRRPGPSTRRRRQRAPGSGAWRRRRGTCRWWRRSRRGR
jgi:hypothetical protein